MIKYLILNFCAESVQNSFDEGVFFLGKLGTPRADVKEVLPLRLGIDIDGTIKQTQKAAVEIYNEYLNRNVRLEDVTTFHLDPAYGLTPKEGARLWRKLEAKIYRLGVPLENAAEALNLLAQEGHEIFFITARPGMKNITEITKEWLTRYRFPYNGENLFMGSQDKAAVSKKLSIELFFEDAPYHLDRLTEAGIPTVIVDAVYNRDYPKPLPRITSWREGVELVRKFSSGQVTQF